MKQQIERFERCREGRVTGVGDEGANRDFLWELVLQLFDDVPLFTIIAD